ncbi:MAG: site-specific DNA-methyltransferase, partial [Acidobacteria bacterium]|nr:site-specific DNA-methyltransferase [Acidobacteriota bacterium]
MTPWTNQLYFGDNLSVLREHIPSESVDLIYLDPPVTSNAPYNVLFKERSGEDSAAQITAFDDTWHWTLDSERAYQEVVTDGPDKLAKLLQAMREFLGQNDMMAYLTMMAQRLAELHRVLKPTGSIYLHCDPTASHYLKMLLDGVFGPESFRTEIAWKRTSAHSDTKQGRQQHGRIHDLLLYYTKSNEWTWNPIFTDYDREYVESAYRHVELGTGRRYRQGDLTAAKPGGDTLYEWRVKRQSGGDWEADLAGEWQTPRTGVEYRGVPPYSGRFWAYSKEKMTAYALEDRLIYSSTGMPNYKRYLDEMPGVPLQDFWADIGPIGAAAKERLGYPTQKPEALLERIINA